MLLVQNSLLISHVNTQTNCCFNPPITYSFLQLYPCSPQSTGLKSVFTTISDLMLNCAIPNWDTVNAETTSAKMRLIQKHNWTTLMMHVNIELRSPAKWSIVLGLSYLGPYSQMHNVSSMYIIKFDCLVVVFLSTKEFSVKQAVTQLLMIVCSDTYVPWLWTSACISSTRHFVCYSVNSVRLE